MIASLAVLALILDRFFLRNNFGARFGDLGAPVAILAAWLPSRFQDGAPWLRGLVWTTDGAGAGADDDGARRRLAACGTSSTRPGSSDSVKKIGRRLVGGDDRASRAASAGRAAPADPEPNAAEYVRLCTASTDRVLVVADAPEILAIAGRSFAGGQPTFRPGFYTLESDQQLTLARMRRESVPVVLLDDEGSYSSHFVPQFRLIHEHVMASYERAGVLPAPAGPSGSGVHAPRTRRGRALPNDRPAVFSVRWTLRQTSFQAHDDRLYRRLSPEPVDVRDREIQRDSGQISRRSRGGSPCRRARQSSPAAPVAEALGVQTRPMPRIWTCGPVRGRASSSCFSTPSTAPRSSSGSSPRPRRCTAATASSSPS